jgi:hypothetical protein
MIAFLREYKPKNYKYKVVLFKNFLSYYYKINEFLSDKSDDSYEKANKKNLLFICTLIYNK